MTHDQYMQSVEKSKLILRKRKERFIFLCIQKTNKFSFPYQLLYNDKAVLLYKLYYSSKKRLQTKRDNERHQYLICKIYKLLRDNNIHKERY